LPRRRHRAGQHRLARAAHHRSLLPAARDRYGALELPRFDFLWLVQTGQRTVADHAIFERQEVEDPRSYRRVVVVAGFLALTLDVVFGLLVSTAVADRLMPRARSVEVHRWLSSVTLALTATHALALLADRFIRFDVLILLVPFAAPYRALAVGLGLHRPARALRAVTGARCFAGRASRAAPEPRSSRSAPAVAQLGSAATSAKITT
jgi:hypothetical protein